MYRQILLNNLKKESSKIRQIHTIYTKSKWVLHHPASNCILKISEQNTSWPQNFVNRPISTKLVSNGLVEKRDLHQQKLTKGPTSSIPALALLDNSSLQTVLIDWIWNQKQDYAFEVLLKYREHHKINDADCFHTLLEIYAKQGDFEKVAQIYGFFREDGVTPVPQTYIFLFECLSKTVAGETQLKLLRQFIDDASQNNISLNDIFDKGVFVRDQREIILHLIHQIDSDFQPIYTPPEMNYSHKLLATLNSNRPETRQPFSLIELHSMSKEQLQIEQSRGLTIEDISKLSKSTSTVSHEFCTQKLKELYTIWRTEICTAFKEKLHSIKNKMEATDENIYPCLTLFTPEQLADMILEYLRFFIQKNAGNEAGGVALYQRFGRRIYHCYELQLKEADGVNQKIRQLYAEYCDVISSNGHAGNSRQIWQNLEYKNRGCGASYDKMYPEWSDFRCIHVGRFLFDILKDHIKIDENLLNNAGDKKPSLAPLLKTIPIKATCSFTFVVHPVLLTLHERTESKTLRFMPDQIPMVSPPVPWTSIYKGAYLITKVPILRTNEDPTKHLAALEQTPATQMYAVFDNLNRAADVPWTINTRTLDVLIDVYNKQITVNDANSKRISELKGKVNTLPEVILYKLSVANYLREKPFWLPQFRELKGRIQSIPPILNHEQFDVHRSLVNFHEKKPLGVDGLKWLKLYCINLMKLKKQESLEDRIKYADECMDDILDSADNPLTGKMWWLGSNKPWQTLSCCIEIANAVRSPNPAQWLSGLPVHVDGSCNALQHYAGLSRNRRLAESVNLSFTEKPQDVYKIVADIIENERAEDAKNGNKIAKVLENHVTRSLLKKGILASIHGGGMERIRATIETGFADIPDFPKHLIKPAAGYLETKYRKSSPLLFKPAHDILMWLKESAFTLAEDLDSGMVFVTPLGIPVVTPYFGIQFQKKGTSFNDALYFPKSVTSFPPNFIHSLEATHMILTSLHCQHAGITFASEHDSFATHACSITELNKICREQFLSLYSEPILENLSAHFQQKYLTPVEKKGDAMRQRNDNNLTDFHVFQRIPKKGDFDLREVLKSMYFFS